MLGLRRLGSILRGSSGCVGLGDRQLALLWQDLETADFRYLDW